MFKRFTALLMVLVLVIGLIPAASAAPETTVDSGEVSIEGTNVFGDLLSEEIAESQEETAEEAAEYPGGYTVTDLEFDGNVAAVTYDSMEEATLVVALYTEDGMQLVTSATAAVTPDATEATVTFGDDMPEYFLASAYLLDSYDLSPLCAAYDTPMYTREMQELLASTVNDYAPEKVLNLDDDETTNFAVYADSTIVIEAVEGANTVASIDDENATYVIQYADEQITSLTEGDVFVYPYAENEILIVKVASITVDGTTVTINGAEISMEEAFSAVKIEGGDSTENMVVDESAADDGVTFEGISNAENADMLMPMNNEGSVEVTKSAKFKVDKDVATKGDAKVNISGSIEFSVKVKLSFYVSATHQYIDFRVEKAISGAFAITGKIEHEWRLCKAAFYPIPCVDIAIEPTFKVEVSGAIEFSATLTGTVGYTFDAKKGLNPLNTTPIFDPDVKAECTIFIGFDLKPQVEVAEGYLAEFVIEVPVGLEFKVSPTGNGGAEPTADDLTYHTCEQCLDLEVFFKIEITVKLQFLKCKWLKVEGTPLNAKFSLGHAYFSFDKLKLGLGTCPYRAYRLTVVIPDQTHIHGTSITVNGQSQTPDENGITIFYLPNGSYTIEATNSDAAVYRNIHIDSAMKITVFSSEDADVVFDTVESNTVEDRSTIIASGSCGNSIAWTLYLTGLLEISGVGEMYNYSTYAPWRSYSGIIKDVVISEGITHIGQDAFYRCSNMSSITIPSSLASIGNYAFQYCNSIETVYAPSLECWLGIAFSNITANPLTNGTQLHFNGVLAEYITIPDNIDTIGQYVFAYCETLKEVTIPDSVTSIGAAAFASCKNLSNVTIPNRVTYIGDSAFSSCSSLTYMTIPDSVTHIGGSAFSGCGQLTSVTIPDSVTSIYGTTFQHCSSLTDVTLPEGITYIGPDAFRYCGSLSQITLPDSVTSIGNFAFEYCESLTAVHINSLSNWLKIGFSNRFANPLSYGAKLYIGGSLVEDLTVPESITALGAWAFAGCTSLKHVTLPKGITTLGQGAFRNCIELESVQLPDSLINLGSGAFLYCTSLKSITIPDQVTTIDSETFQNCTSLTSVTIPAGITSIKSEAFYQCTNLRTIKFEGDVPTFGAYAFGFVTATAFYPTNNATWTADVMQNCGGTITWVPYTPDTGNTIIGDLTQIPTREPAVEIEAVYGGDYDTEITDEYTLKTASFTGLVPNEQYVMLAMVSIEVDDPLTSENLLFIDQAAAREDGTLVFQYVQRTPCDISYVVACGASHKNLKDAEITFPEMFADGELQVVDPLVVYDGETLIEGRDYVIVGSVDFTEAGTYTCSIRGIHNYTGLVECPYTVLGEVASGWSGVTQWSLRSDGLLTVYGEGNMKNYGYNGGQPWLGKGVDVRSVIIEEGVTAVGTGAFRNLTTLESVSLPQSGLSKIGEAAFYGCTALTEIDIPDTIYTIWAYTFKNCSALTSVGLPKTLIKIDQGAFEGCTSLPYIYIPGDTQIIGSWSFKGCTALAEAEMTWADATEIREGAFKNCSALTTIHLPGGIETFGDSAFYGIGADSFTVPATVTTVGPWCFARASLTEITFEGDAPAIGEGAFNKIALTAHYPDGNATWTADVLQNYGGTVTWTAN